MYSVLSNIGIRAFRASGAAVWNDLPAHVTAAPSLAVFRRRLKDISVLALIPWHCHLTYKLCIHLLYLCGPRNNFIIQATLKILMMMMMMSNSSAKCYKCFPFPPHLNGVYTIPPVDDWVQPIYINKWFGLLFWSIYGIRTLTASAVDITVWSVAFDCIVVFNTDEICIDSGTELHIICSLWPSPITTSVHRSSSISFAFQLQTGDVITCESSPGCNCHIMNETAVKMSCQYLPAEYDNSSLSCYLQDNPSISVQAPVYVRGNVCIGSVFCSDEEKCVKI